jgi:hypothetical protein
MKSIRLITLGIIAAGSIIGAVSASAATAPTPSKPEANSSLVTEARYCWWEYGVKHCRGGGYYKPYYKPYYRPYYKPYRYRY